MLKNCSEIILHDIEKSGSNSGLNVSFHNKILITSKVVRLIQTSHWKEALMAV